MRIGTTFFAVAAALLATTGVAQAQQRPNGARDMMLSLGGGFTGKKLARAIAEAEKHPLGSNLNPVRENQPEGEVAYLRRLRCEDGTAPQFQRRGNVGEGVFGFIVDKYEVQCAGKDAVYIFMDMYHDGPEDRPVPGFTIVAQ